MTKTDIARNRINNMKAQKKNGEVPGDNKLRTIANQEAEVWDSSPYYEDAEKWLWIFWSENREFFPLFNQLDKTYLLELACGHGRHSEYLLNHFGGEVKSLILMDILQSNIDFSETRIGVRNDVSFIKNDGADFRPVPNASITGIFCYDAMVHFNREVVKAYLFDTQRVLVPGGKALFHHSNYSFDPDMHFGQNPHARAFMSAGLFKKYANEAGLDVVDQKIMPWGKEFDLDCLTLVARPN